MHALHLVFRAGALGAAFALAGACSSSDDGGGKNGGGDYAPPGNGVAMPEADACKAIVDAENARYAEAKCGPVTRPPCPYYLAKGNPACSEYDQGTVQACVAWIGQQSCDALKTKKCIVAVLPGTEGKGCPPDAGGDAEVDAGPDAPSDAAEDASEDGAPDAPAEAANDATAAEAGSDGGGD
jgi:hypothetical protein